MTSECKTILYPVKDMEAAKRIYTTLLGTKPTTDDPSYVGFSIDGQEIGLIPLEWADGMTGPLPYWEVADIEQAESDLIAAGAESTQAPQDVGGGKRIAKLKDAEGNFIGISQSS